MIANSLIPWWARILVKIVLARLPVPYSFWSQIGIFRHGKMNLPEYAYKIFVQHYKLCNPEPGFVCLELGPGDSLCSSIISFSLGAKRSYLVDAGNFVSHNMKVYHAMIDFLKNKNMIIPVIGRADTQEVLLEKCKSSYLSNGLKSLKKIPDGSVDFIYSQAVLEHINKNEFIIMNSHLFDWHAQN